MLIYFYFSNKKITEATHNTHDKLKSLLLKYPKATSNPDLKRIRESNFKPVFYKSSVKTGLCFALHQGLVYQGDMGVLNR